MSVKETIITIMQQRMDKTTTEQYWAVATLSGMDAFVLSQLTDLKQIISGKVLLLVVSIATGYGVWFVIQRHVGYYFLRSQLVELLRAEPEAPAFLRRGPTRKSNTWSGVVFYVGWMALLWGVVAAAIAKPGP
jgi:hypothetical protein